MNLMLTQGNALRIPLADESVHCVVTSPPYWGLRDYGVDGQLGLEPTIDEFIESMTAVFETRCAKLADSTPILSARLKPFQRSSTWMKPKRIS